MTPSKKGSKPSKFGSKLLEKTKQTAPSAAEKDANAELASKTVVEKLPGEKLQKVLAQLGMGSRREIEGWITDGRVKVNGEKAALGTRIKKRDSISVDGRPVTREKEENRRVLVYNKPEGEVCTRKDPEGRPTVFERLPKLKGERWIAVGRLDLNTSGLLLFTTDGELAHRLMHPSTHTVDREYAVRVAGDVTEDVIKQLLKGVQLEDGLARFTDIQYFDGDGFNKWFHVVLMEGKNREVRRLWESQGIQVSRLKRVRYGCVFLPKDIPVGTWREMKQREVDDLADLVQLTSVPVKPLIGKEKESYLRQAQRQKTRQKAGGTKSSMQKPKSKKNKAEQDLDDGFMSSKPKDSKPKGSRSPRKEDRSSTKKKPLTGSKPKPKTEGRKSSGGAKPNKPAQPRKSTGKPASPKRPTQKPSGKIRSK